MWFVLAVVIAILWFRFVRRPFPKYLFLTRDAMLSDLSYRGELVYASSPRTVSEPPFCYQRHFGVFDIGNRAVYRYHRDGQIEYVTVWFDFDMPTSIPSSIELKYTADRPDRVFAAHGGVVRRYPKGIKYWLYYSMPAVICIAGLLIQAGLFS